jgi:hypothetical protein
MLQRPGVLAIGMLFVSRRLHDAVERHELGCDEPSDEDLLGRGLDPRYRLGRAQLGHGGGLLKKVAAHQAKHSPGIQLISPVDAVPPRFSPPGTKPISPGDGLRVGPWRSGSGFQEALHEETEFLHSVPRAWTMIA